MGRDKAQLPFGGSSLLEHALETLRCAGFMPSVAGLRTISELDPNRVCNVSAPCLSDRFVNAGPLGGIEAALHSLANEPPQATLFVPTDLPLLPPRFLEALRERAATSGAWATVPYSMGRPQPLCAVYDSRLANGITEALASKDRKVMRVLRRLVPEQHFDSFRIEALAPLYGWNNAHQWFTNLNTPADWEALMGRS